MKDKSAKGVVPGQVSVPMPGMNSKSKPAPAKKVKAPAGFSGGVIPGKI